MALFEESTSNRLQVPTRETTDVKPIAVLTKGDQLMPNSSLKVAPFGRWTPQKRGAL
jgi:hypothetical protein